MVRSIAPLVFLIIAAPAVTGCHSSLSREKATAVLKDLAKELVLMEGSSIEDRMERVKLVCEKNGVEVESFARYLHENPEAEKLLADHMNDLLANQIEQKKAAFRQKLEEFDKQNRESIEAVKAEMKKRIKEIEETSQAEIERLKSDFNKRREDTLKAISELQLK